MWWKESGACGTPWLDEVTDYQAQRFLAEVNQAATISTLDIKQHVDWPPPQSFVSLTAESAHLHHVPTITKCQIEHYIVCRQVLDRKQNEDSSAMKSGSRMLEDCVEGMSLYSNGSAIYFIGVVSAEMKTKVSYSVKATISQLSGDPLESSYDCPVGQVQMQLANMWWPYWYLYTILKVDI